MKRVVAALALCLALSGCVPSSSANRQMDEQGRVSGTFTGTGQGKQGEIKVDVMIDHNQIQHIEILSHNEIPGFDTAMVQMSDEILSKNSLQVEAVSGATYTSKGFLEAVQDALDQAGIREDQLGWSDEENEEQEIECDVLIVGGGGAGFAAAIEALTQSSDEVTIVEKMSFGGGNTRMSGGEFAAPGNWVQLQEGIDNDSPELFYEDLMKGGKNLGNPELVRILADNALSNAEWLRDIVGVQYRDHQSWYGGHTVARTLWPIGDGPQYVETLIRKAEALGVNVEYNTRAERFLQDETGRVIGVEATRGGRPLRFYARKGVILTTGGFGANVEMRMQYDTHWNKLDASIPTTNSPAITGDGLRMAEAIGAKLVGMEYIQLYPVNNPATGNYYFLDYARLTANALLVNKEGLRFVDEKETRDNLSEAALNQTGAMIYELIEQSVVDEMQLDETIEAEVQRCYDQGVLAMGTLDECAAFFDIPVKTLKATVDRYNQYAAAGRDPDFGRTDQLQPLGEGPYMMFSAVVSVHHTMGGVQIDPDARVLDTEGHPIPGLYAAGEVTGGIHGANRLGSCSIPDTVTFGRIAARSALAMK